MSNSAAAGKRPLNNVCPIIVRMADRDVAIGVRGGRRIVSVMAQIADRVTRGAGARAAAIAPRIHTITGDPVEVSAGVDVAALLDAGYGIDLPEEVAGAAHGAEVLRGGGLRGGGGTWAAGV